MAFNQKQIDGGVIEGSRKLTIQVGTSNASTAPQIYFTDNYSIDTPTSDNDRTDENNHVNGDVMIVGKAMGSATLQLSALDQPLPFPGNRFEEDYHGLTCTHLVRDVGLKLVKAGLATVDIKFKVALTNDVKTLDSDGVWTTETAVVPPA